MRNVQLFLGECFDLYGKLEGGLILVGDIVYIITATDCPTATRDAGMALGIRNGIIGGYDSFNGESASRQVTACTRQLRGGSTAIPHG